MLVLHPKSSTLKITCLLPRVVLIARPEDSALTTSLALDLPPRSPCEPRGLELLTIPPLAGSWRPQARPVCCPPGGSLQRARLLRPGQPWCSVKESWLNIYLQSSLWGPTQGDRVWGCRCPFSANRRKEKAGIYLCRNTVHVVQALRSLPLE